MTKYLYLLLLLFCIAGKNVHAQIISTIAGNGIAGYSGDGGASTSASLSRPISCVMDNTGNLLISDFTNNCIRKINPSGIITTIAGTGTSGFSGDGGPATAAEIFSPEKITCDGAGNIYFCDYFNQRVRKINAAGIITTVAGSGVIGYSGDGGQATAATFWYPAGITLDATGNIYISDEYNNRIRKINTSGIITTIAGNGPIGYYAGGYGGDGGPATAAQISFPVGMATDTAGDIIFSDDGNSRIRKISPSGIITTIVGNGTLGSAGDGGPATLAQLQHPEGLALDQFGSIYICETYGGNKVRKVDASTNVINTLAANGIQGFLGDGGPATASEMDIPEGIFVDTSTSCIYICDSYNNRVRIVGTCANPQIGVCDSISMPDSLHLCKGDTVTLSAIIIGTDSVSNISWMPATGLSNTSVLHPVVTATISGWYYLTVESLIPGCTVIDSIYIQTIPSDIFFSHTDTGICALGTPLILTAPIGYISPTWSTGAITSSVTVTDSGTYWVKTTHACTELIDTFYVSAKPLPFISLGNDTAVCPGYSITFSSPLSVGSFLWSTGSTAPSITITSGGTYLLTVTNEGCSATDSVEVKQLFTPSPINLGPDTTLCKGNMFILSSSPQTALWSTGETATSISITDSNTYSATVANVCGSSTSFITVNFVPCDIFFPSAFTPNNDGLNDVARAVGNFSLFSNYKLSIYDRWGQRIFYTEDIYAGWDGKNKGIPQDIGTYFYMIVYTLDGKQYKMKGDITLIR